MQYLVQFLIIVVDLELIVFWAGSMEKRIWGYFQESRSSNSWWNVDTLLIKMKPERTWQNERKMSVGGSESLNEVKEKCAVSLQSWCRESRKIKCAPFSQISRMVLCLCVCVCVCPKWWEIQKQLKVHDINYKIKHKTWDSLLWDHLKPSEQNQNLITTAPKNLILSLKKLCHFLWE